MKCARLDKQSKLVSFLLYSRKLSYVWFAFGVALMATFFFLVFLHIFYTPLPSKKSPLIIYSNQLNTSLRHLVIHSLKQTTSHIHLHTYALSDEAVIKTLLDKSSSLKTLQVLSDTKTIYPQHKPLTEKLNWKGVPSSGLMHEKILVLDQELVFLGTANMTYESLSMHDNVILGFHHKELASFLIDYTENIEKIKKHKNLTSQTFSIGKQKLSLWLLPFKGSSPLSHLEELISSATSSIDIAMFTLTHPSLLNHLVQAKKRGVKVRVFLDATSGKGASQKAALFLKEAGVPIYLSQGLQLLHHKMMIIDNSSFVLGSANWTKAAFTKNHDFYLTLSPLTKNQYRSIKSIFKNIAKQTKKL